MYVCMGNNEHLFTNEVPAICNLNVIVYIYFGNLYKIKNR